ncbi:MAG: hypothetical protein H7257_11270 [Taibaiella sp.]|nr:hypothetical protein [Taibaiella sp.]
MTGNEIVKAALLGTEKYMPATWPELGETGTKIMALPTGSEDRFLKLAITALLYEEAGRKPVAVAGTIPICPPEVRPLAGAQLALLLRTALETNDTEVFQYFVYLVTKKNLVLPAEMVPMLLNKALANKRTAERLVQLCGETGRWLCGFNERWRTLLLPQEGDNVWETGTPESRKAYLLATRRADPALAVSLLASTIDKENAANRVALLEQLQVNLSPADEPFLLGLVADKSPKVKQTAISLLQRIPGSAINTMYLQYLRQTVQIKEERYLLIAKKKVLVISEVITAGEELYDTGIEKLSAAKDMPDYLFIIGQLISLTDPAVLAGELGVKEEELLTMLLQHKEGQKLLPYLANAAALYANKVWARILLARNDGIEIKLLEALPETERRHFYGQFVAEQLPELLSYLFDDVYSAMDVPLAEQILTQLIKKYYKAQVYNRLALHLPFEVMPRLNAYIDNLRDDYNGRYVKGNIAGMIRIMEVKRQYY